MFIFSLDDADVLLINTSMADVMEVSRKNENIYLSIKLAAESWPFVKTELYIHCLLILLGRGLRRS